MDVPEHASHIEPGLIQAYRATRFRVDQAPPFWLQVDVPSPALAALMRTGGHRDAVFVTAWNPEGDVLTGAENAQRHRVLVDELEAAALEFVTGAGEATGNWTEEASLLVFGVDRAAACELGRRHRQNAMVWAGPDAVPRLLLLR